MKISPGSPAGTAPSGAVGSLVASHGRHGYYLRARSKPTNPNTRRQQQTKAIFTTLVNVWANTLNPAQQRAWDIYGQNTPVNDRLGIPVLLTGQNQFIRTNTPRIQVGLTRVDSAPTTFNTGLPFTSINGSVSGTPRVIEINTPGQTLRVRANLQGEAPASGMSIMYLSAPTNASRTFFKGPFQYAAKAFIFAGDTGDIFSTAFSAMTNANGILVAGQFRSIRLFVLYDDGRIPEALTLLAPVVD